jgi:hypothetical protein
MNTSAGIDLRDFLFEDEGSVDGAACGGDTGNEDFSAVGLKDFSDTAPMSDLERCDCRTDGDGIETE